MKIPSRFSIRTLALADLVLLLTVGVRHASPLQDQRATSTHPLPTLARLSFWVPPARMAEFESAYEAKVAPILKAHSLTESADRGRATPDSIFSRLFELKTPSEVEEKQKALQGDSTWTAALRGLGAAFGTTQPDSLIRWFFSFYAAPASAGKVVSAGRGTGHWRTYDMTDGLAAGHYVFSILQDREGYLWFGTYGGGVSRYDGQTFTNFTTGYGLGGIYVSSILQDREGHLWFGGGGGVSRYDGKTFTAFTTKDGLVNNRVRSILQDREGNLWFGTGGGGVSRYDGHGFTTFTTKDGLANNFVPSILQDREGHLWFGTAGSGVSRYDGKTFTSFTTKDGLAVDYVWSIFQDRDGVLWFGTGWDPDRGGVSRYDGHGFTNLTTKDGLANNIVSSIIQDREGNLWFCTFGGVSRYDGKAFTTFTTRDGLVNNEVWSITQDREENLWFGAAGGGVSRYDDKTFTTFTTKDGLASDQVISIIQDREGNLWFSTGDSGVSRYDGKTFTTFTKEDGLADYVGSIFQDREGNLWFGIGGGGVRRYDGKTFTTFSTADGLGSNAVRSIIQDREGNLWFGAEGGGVSRYDPSTGSGQAPSAQLRAGGKTHSASSGQAFTTFTTADGLAGNGVDAIFQDREGHIWVCTSDGVSRYDGQRWIAFTIKDGLGTGRVRSIIQDREGRLWVGADGGMSRYDGQTFTPLTAKDGFPDNARPKLQDREGVLWFTGGGVGRYDGKTFQTMTRQDGLADNSVGSILQDRDGNFWFGTGGGLMRYRPPAPSPPPVFVDAVVSDRRYEKVSQLTMPSSVKLTAFEFHGMSFKTRPEAMVYRYRLKGYDKDWQNTHAQRVEYQNLPGGNYTFEVVAVDRDLVYSEKPATVALRVHLPYLLIGLWSALSVAVALVAWQTARVIRRDRRLQVANAALSSANKDLFQVNRELEEANRQVQEATRRKSAFLASMSHELRTPMNAIIGFTNLVLRRRSENLTERQQDNLTKVKLSADHLLSLINDILDLSKVEAGRVDIKAAPFDVKALIESCCATVGPLVRSGVQLNPEVSEEMGEAHTDEARLRQIIINLLSNALKFTEKGEVRVSVWPSPRQATLATPLPHVGEEGGGSRPHGSDRLSGPSEVRRGEGLSSDLRPSVDKLLEIAVSDTGVGIPPDALGYIFEEFRQVEGSHQQQKGTGLGLSITKKLTELLGGTISVESEVGKGSTFTVRIPLVYQGN